MAYSESRIGRVRVKAQSGWGTIATGFVAADTIECELTYPEMVREAITLADSIQGTFNHGRFSAGSKVGSTFSLSMPLHGWSATTPTDNPSVHPDALLLALALGGSEANGYNASSLIGGSATGAFTSLDASAAIHAWEGNAQLVPMNDTQYSVGWVKTVTASTPDQVNFVNHLGANYSGTVDNQPRSGGAIYGSNTCYMTRGTTTTPLTIQWEGAKASTGNMLVSLYDCIVTSAKITASPREQPRLEVELIAGNWTSDGSGGDPGAYTFDLPQLPVFTGENGARMVIDNTSDAAVATHVSSFEFNVDVETVEVGSHSGDQGIAQFAVTNRTCTVEITQPVDALLTTRDPGYEPGAIQLDLAGTPGQALSICMFAPVLTDLAGVGDSDGLVSQTFAYGAGAYSGDTAGNGAAVNTPARVAFL